MCSALQGRNLSKFITKSRIFASASMLCFAVSFASQASAQDADEPQGATEEDGDDAIYRNRFAHRATSEMESATPVTAVETEELQTLSPSTLDLGDQPAAAVLRQQHQ